MYLVHVRVLLPPEAFGPEGVRDFFRSHALPDEGVEHVSVHGGADGVLTVGFFVQSDALLAAEGVALAVAERAVDREPGFRGARVVGGSGALVAEFYDGMLAAPGHDGRSMRGPDQDSGQSWRETPPAGESCSHGSKAPPQTRGRRPGA
ncbi:hypothetical protein ABZ114_26515 [Streptomyces albidoflavus]|uniref:hypothetical protein n=1 Tax=Streptomyces TaxID=1883 RepID=UPI00069E4308|nr:hypothetical protein [Streptomyces sp. KE1]